MYRSVLNEANGIGQLYQTGERFSLAGWSADEWAKFFTAVEPSAAHLYGTVTGSPVPQPLAPQVTTPIGGVPTWAILGLVAVGGLVLLSSGRRR